MDTAVTKTQLRRPPLTPWELPLLLTPLHTFRRSRRKRAKDRPHFPAVLSFVHRNRFAIGSQVQRRFPMYFRSARTTRRHLEDMQILGYLSVAPTRSASPLFPKVYYVTGRGIRKLREVLTAQGKPWQAVPVDRRSRHSLEGYSSERILHEILVTEFLLSVWQTIKARPDLELLTIQRRSLVKHSAFRVDGADRPTRLEPDAMFLFRQREGGMICSFLELDRGTMNIKQIKTKYRRYETWSQSEAGQQYLVNLYSQQGAVNPRPSFRLLVVANDRAGIGGSKRLLALYKAALDLPTGMRDRLWFTTFAALQEHQHDPLSLEASIWYRGRDAHSWLAEYRLRAQTYESDPKTAKQMRQFIRERVNGLPGHPLFPLPPVQ